MRPLTQTFPGEIASPIFFVFTVAAFSVLGTGGESDIIRELYTCYNTIFLYSLKDSLSVTVQQQQVICICHKQNLDLVH